MEPLMRKGNGSWLGRTLVLVLFAGAPALVFTQSSSDSKFASEAASGGMTEVKLGELAQQNRASTSVKDFGRRMETDHSKADDNLKQAAEKAKISLPTNMSAEDQATYDRLSKLHGGRF
ncbi:MAG: DUF4142 domain-containing protein [Candidatus Acidiferrales bacterium]